MKWFQKLNIHMYVYTLKIWKPDSFYGDKIGGNLLHLNFPITINSCVNISISDWKNLHVNAKDFLKCLNLKRLKNCQIKIDKWRSENTCSK